MKAKKKMKHYFYLYNGENYVNITKENKYLLKYVKRDGYKIKETNSYINKILNFKNHYYELIKK